MSTLNINPNTHAQYARRTIFRLTPPPYGRAASKRECFAFENAAMNLTCALAA